MDGAAPWEVWLVVPYVVEMAGPKVVVCLKPGGVPTCPVVVVVVPVMVVVEWPEVLVVDTAG